MYLDKKFKNGLSVKYLLYLNNTRKRTQLFIITVKYFKLRKTLRYPNSPGLSLLSRFIFQEQNVFKQVGLLSYIICASFLGDCEGLVKKSPRFWTSNFRGFLISKPTGFFLPISAEFLICEALWKEFRDPGISTVRRNRKSKPS